jgi:hypothetical protein
MRINPPFQIWQETDGTPLDLGYIYVGTANTNPITNPVQLYWDTANSIAAAQPIRTVGGYAMRNGSPAAFYTAASDYSITVQNRNAVQVYTAASLTQNLGVSELDSAGIATALLTQFYQKSVVLPISSSVGVQDTFGGGSNWWEWSNDGWISVTNGALLDVPFPALVPGTLITKVELKVKKAAGTVTLTWLKRDTEIGTPANIVTETNLATIFAGHTSGAWSVKTWTGSYTTLAEDHHFIRVLQGSADQADFAGGWVTCQPMLPFAP